MDEAMMYVDEVAFKFNVKLTKKHYALGEYFLLALDLVCEITEM